MKKILLLLLIGIFFSCNSSVTNQSDSPQPSRMAAKINPTPTIQRDTIPTPSVKRRSNVITDTSRSKDEINSKFPFDISMTTGDRKTVNSETKLASNGKPTVILFWLTTCYPCRMEMSAIKKVYAQWQEEADFNLYAISTDFQKNYDKFIKRVETEKWPWETLHDTNREFRKVLPGALNGLPQTFIFDKNGEIVYRKRKYSTGDEHNLFKMIKKIAAQ